MLPAERIIEDQVVAFGPELPAKFPLVTEIFEPCLLMDPVLIHDKDIVHMRVLFHNLPRTRT